MKGDSIKLDFATRSDPVTGIPVTRLSDGIGDTYHPYFTMPLLASDGSYLLVASNRTGEWQLHIIYLKEQRMVQVTEGEGVQAQGALLDRKNHRVYYIQQNMLKSVRLDTLEDIAHLHIPKGFYASQLSITDDGRYLAFTYTEEVELCDPSKADRTTVSLLGREHFYRRPSSVVIRYDVQRDKYQAVWGEREWISHTNISPLDPNLILFCHETSWYLVQRMWISKVNTDEVYPLVRQRYNLDRIGHEFFMADGRVAAQFSIRHTPDVPFYQHGDLFVCTDGTQEQRFFYPYTRPEHFQMNHAIDMGVGDYAHIRAGQTDKKSYISLQKYHQETGSITVGLLCRHDSSWQDQKSHPHPFFSWDDQTVFFSSHTNGRCNVYMAPALWEKCIYSE